MTGVSSSTGSIPTLIGDLTRDYQTSGGWSVTAERVVLYTSKYIHLVQVQKSFNGDVRRDGMHHAKNCGDKEIPLEILSRILAQIPLPIHNSGKGYTHV